MSGNLESLDFLLLGDARMITACGGSVSLSLKGPRGGVSIGNVGVNKPSVHLSSMSSSILVSQNILSG